MSGRVFLGIVLQKKKSILLYYFFLKIKENVFRLLIQLIQFIFTKAVTFTLFCLLTIYIVCDTVMFADGFE